MLTARERAATVLSFLQTTLAGGAVSVRELEVSARDAGLLGERQSITDAKRFRAAKRRLAIRSVRIGFGAGGEWGWALPSPETSVDPAIEVPTTVVYGEGHSRPDQPDHHAGAGTDHRGGAHSDPIPTEWIKGVACLDYGRAPDGVLPHRWRQFVGDCHGFMASAQNWAPRAAKLGWSPESLFGCCSSRPLDHLGSAGLIWNLGGGKLTHLSADWAMMQAPGGSQRTYHRRPSTMNVMLPWRLR